MKKENKKKYYVYKMNMAMLNLISIVLFFLLIFISYQVCPNLINDYNLKEYNFGIVIILFLGYMCLHELLHSLAYVIYGGKFNKIIYGIALELGVFYCLCKQNITKKNILYSLMYPLVIIGIFTYIIGVIFHLPLLVILSIINLIGCSGDIIMFIFISKLKNIEFSEMDDPVAFGIYSSEDLSKVKHFGLDYIGETDELERKDFKKIKISKLSYVVIAILLLIAILNF